MKLLLVLAGLVLAVSLAHGEDCPELCGKQGGGVECADNQCCSEDGKCGFGDDHCGDNCQSGACHLNKKQRCGRAFDNKKCTNNYCCNGDGYCGFGVAYCSINSGCQSGFCAKAACSETKACTNNQCCGPKGICGIGRVYCGDGCKGGPCYFTVAANATSARDGAPPASSLSGPPSPQGPTATCKGRCGRQNDYAECQDNQCCSKDGKCGLDRKHCGVGCQSGPCFPSSKRRCGSSFGQKKCTNNYCCGADGFCGVGVEYCQAGCQPAFGFCYHHQGENIDMYCGVYGFPKVCFNNFCCSREHCGLGPNYCDRDGCTGVACYYPDTLAAAAAANANATMLPPASSAVQ